MPQSFTLTLTCAQRPGIVHAVSSFLLQQNCDISEHQQFDDTQNGAFFLRTSFVPVDDMGELGQVIEGELLLGLAGLIATTTCARTPPGLSSPLAST